MRRSGRRAAAAVCGFGLVIATLVACGSGDATNSQDATGGAPNPAFSGGPEDVDDLLAQLSDPDSFTFPGPTEPVTSIEKHKITIVVDGLSVPGTPTLMPYVAEAAEAIGWDEPQVLDGKFSPATQASSITQALNNGTEGLVLGAISPSTVRSALQPALDAGMPVVCLNCGLPTDPGNDVEGVTFISDSPTATAQAWAVWVAATSGGDAKVALFNDSEYSIVNDRFVAAQDAFAQYCPDCEVVTDDVTIAQILEPSVPTFRSFLQSNPQGTIDYIVAPQDIAMPLWAQAAAQAGRTDIKFIGYAGLPPVYDYIAKGDPPGAAATVAIAIPYYGWAAVDQLARLFNDQPTWDGSGLPTGLVTRENFKEFEESVEAQGRVPSISSATDFRAEFMKLWGK